MPILDGSAYNGRVPCLLCRHARRRKTRQQWETICGPCRRLSADELEILHWNQECDPDRVVVPPNMLRHSRMNSDARYVSAFQYLKAWQLAAGARVLDIGCGISAQAEMFHGWRYVGADVSVPRLGYAARTHPWAWYTAQSVGNLGFAAGAFDAVLCLEVVEHLAPAERPALARELLRVLRPGGLLILTTPDGRMTVAKHLFGTKCERSHERELTRREVETLLAGVGAWLVECRPLASLVQPAGRLAAVLAHFAGDRPAWRGRLAQWWGRVGDRTLLYLATPP